jgi:hypothetical protein
MINPVNPCGLKVARIKAVDGSFASKSAFFVQGRKPRFYPHALDLHLCEITLNILHDNAQKNADLDAFQSPTALFLASSKHLMYKKSEILE